MTHQRLRASLLLLVIGVAVVVHIAEQGVNPLELVARWVPLLPPLLLWFR